MADSKKITLDGKELPNKESLIKYIYAEISAPETAAINWDALWDMLTDEDYVNPDTSALIIVNVEDILASENEQERDTFFELVEDLEEEGGWAVAMEESF